MKRICLFFVIAMLLFLIPSAAKAKSVSLSIEGEPVYCSSPPVIVEGRTLIPSSVLVSILEVSIRWNSTLQRMILSYEGSTIEMKIGSIEAKVNGNSVTMEAAPMIINGSKMIPLRFFATSFGYNVAWEDATKTVLLTRKVEPPKDETPKPPTTKPEQETPQKPETEKEETEQVVLPTMDRSVIYGVTAEDGDEENYVYLEISKPIRPRISMLSDPMRLVLDFDKTVLKKTGKIKELSLIEEVRYNNQTDDSARVVIEMEEMLPYVCYYKNGKYCIVLREDANEVSFSDGTLLFPENTEVKLMDKKASGITFSVSPAVSEQTIPINAHGISGISVKKSGKASKVSVMFTTPQKAVIRNHTVVFEHEAFSEIRDEYEIDEKVTIVLDAGHGGTDPGAIGYNADGSIGVKESVANLYITLRVAELLEDCGMDVHLTRSDDIFVDLYDRAKFANNLDADYFVSIHNNASDADKTVEGTMVMYMTSSVRGAKLAKTVLTSVIEETNQNNLGMRVGDKLVVIRATAMPAVLVEGGFLTTPDEMERLKDAAFLDTLAAGIAKGVLENTLSELK